MLTVRTKPQMASLPHKEVAPFVRLAVDVTMVEDGRQGDKDA